MNTLIRLIAISLLTAVAAAIAAGPTLAADRRGPEPSKVIKGSKGADKEKDGGLRGARDGDQSGAGSSGGSGAPSDFSITKNTDKASPGKQTDKASPD